MIRRAVRFWGGRWAAGLLALAAVGCGAGRASEPPAQAPLTIAAEPEASRWTPIVDPRKQSPVPARGQQIASMGPIRIGQPLAEVREQLGPESRVVSANDERSSWESAGYSTESSPIFAAGFDSLLVWDSMRAEVEIPFWKIYEKGGRVATIVVTSYGSEGRSGTLSAGFGPSCFLLGDEEGIEATLGPSPLIVADQKHHHMTYYYLDRGLSVLAEDGKIRVFNVFAPIERTRQTRLEGLLRDMAAKVPEKTNGVPSP